MRPVSIVRFEQAYLASVVLWLVNLALGWKARLGSLENNPAFAGNPQMGELAQTMMIGTTVFMLILWLLLWYFTARRASEVAKWVVVALFGLSVVGLPFTLMSYPVVGVLSVVLSLVAFVVTAYAVWMLFRPDARAWFAGTAPESEAAPSE
ncbi:hypothetical protein [Sphingomonas sp. MS122]|uniref:hypothetical protein n=1 Tax=Sphingomonas sp. MS122 TaxID=3412683 RepID=UPI003C2F2580